MNTNAIAVGAILIGLAIASSPSFAQTFPASSSGQTADGDSRGLAVELLRRARTAMKGGNLALAERFIAQAEKLDVKQEGFLGRFTDTPEKARRELNRLQQGGAAGPARLKGLLGGGSTTGTPARLPDDAVQAASQLPAPGGYPVAGQPSSLQ